MELSPHRKVAGILTPLFALRGANDMGVGDVGALRELVDWAALNSLRVVQLLPVNETGNDNSPYNAISSVALDPLTIEISCEAIPDLTEAVIAEEKGRFLFRKTFEGPVLYKVVKPLKRALLHRAFAFFRENSLRKNDRRARAFRDWLKEQESWLPGFAFFRVLMSEHGGSERWDQWPAEHRTLSQAREWLATLSAAERKEWEVRMQEVGYVQWVAWSQWKAVKEYAESKGVALMGDVPFGVSYYSADYFSDPEIFDSRWSGGAPPEPAFQSDLFTARWGQNWGVPLYRWDVLKERNLDWWRQRVGKVREVFHLFRIDHVLGFYRVYGFPWRPEFNAEFAALSEQEVRARTGGELPRFHPRPDDSLSQRQANRADGEALLSALAEETGEFRLIGEDLGTVPDYVRPSMQSIRVAGFKVPMWELAPDTRLIAGDAYEELSVATYATHDHPPLRFLWEHWMEVIALGESGRWEDAEARNRAWWEVRRLAEWAGLEVPRILPFEQVHEGFLKGLLRCNSWIAIFMITDLLGTTQRFNVPGAVADSNWSERVALPVAKWGEERELRARMARLRPFLERHSPQKREGARG